MIMKELITKHFEKLICIAALLGVCIACVLAMSFHLEDRELTNIEPKGVDVIKKIEPKELVDLVIKTKENNDAYDGSGYVYCRNLVCASLVNGSHERCKKCNTTIKLITGPEPESDSDKDLISNKIEIRENMDPKNPDDAAQDRDKDGFSNFDELVTFEGKAGCIDDDKDHPPFIMLYGAIKTPVKPLPFKVTKIAIVPNANPAIKDRNLWEVQLSVTIKNRKTNALSYRKITRTIADKEAIGEDKDMNYTLVAIAVDETDPENSSKMKLTFENADKEQVVAEFTKDITPPKSFKIEFSDGKTPVVLTQLGDFTLKGPNNEVQNYTLRAWDEQKSVAKVFCKDDKTESDIGAKPAVKCPVKKQ